MRSALFVDDEPLLLEGLRRLLRPLRHEWEMTFVPSAAAALAVLAERHFDVVVTDMRMAEMDGAALLEHVRRRHPDAARIMLTGQTDREAAIRTMHCAHRFLNKPCAAETLLSSLERACRLRELVRQERVASIASSLGSLPSLPELYHELNAELASQDPSMKRVTEILRKDLAISAKVLQLVNSAFFGAPRKVTAVEQAVGLLGTDLIRTIVLSNGAFAALQGSVAEATLGALRAHSIAVGAAARAISRHEGVSRAVVEEATQAGFLHDIGRLVLDTVLPKESSAALELAARERIPLNEAETSVLGCTHAAIGAYVLGLWGLPDEIVEPVAYHHDPAATVGHGFTASVAVYAANELVAATEEHGGSAAGPMSLAAVEWTEKLDVWTALLSSGEAGVKGAE